MKIPILLKSSEGPESMRCSLPGLGGIVNLTLKACANQCTAYVNLQGRSNPMWCHPAQTLPVKQP